MASVMEIVVRAQDQASGVIEGIGDRAEQVSDAIDQHWEKVAAGSAAAGAGLEAMARGQQENRAVAGRLANALEGETVDSIMAVAAEAHNATTDLDELVAMMETGRQQGLRSVDELQDYAQTWDMIGDATGESAGKLADSSSALRAVGIAAGQEERAMGAFGFITQETTGSVGEFLHFIDRAGPEIRDLGADIDDSAAILGVMEHELGMSGRTARQEFRTAIRESDGTLNGLLDTLGIGQDTFEDYRGKVAASTDVIEDNAEAFAESRTITQELWADVEALGARFSGLTAAASNLSPALMGTGGAIFGFQQLREATSGMGGRLGRIARNATGASSGLRGMGRAAGIAAAVVVVDEALSRLNDTMIEMQYGAVPAADEMTLALEGLAQTGEMPASTFESFEGITDALDASAAEGFTGALQDMTRTAAGIPGVGLFAPGLERDAAMLERAEESTKAFDAAMADAVRAGNDEALAAGMEVLAEQTGLSGDELEEYARQRLPGYAKALDSAELAQDDAADSADGLAGGLDDLEAEVDDATSAVDGYIESVRAAEDPVFALDKALRGVEDAQDAYNEAVKEHGPNSDEARQASMELMGALSEVEAAAINGDLSFSEFDRRLQGWVEQGHITAEQAAAIRDRVNEARSAAENFSGNYEASMTLRARFDDTGIPSNLRQSVPYQHFDVIPGLAGGGEFGPGWIMVGEEGPELMHIDSGTSGEVFSNTDTRRMLSSGPTGGLGAAGGGSVEQLLASIDRKLDQQGATIVADGEVLARVARRHGRRQADRTGSVVLT